MEILIVEDEIEIAQLIQLYLEREGFSCRHCRDGLSAIQVFQAQLPDLIILDLMIPVLDGLEVCARIRQQASPKESLHPHINGKRGGTESHYRVVNRS